MYKAISVNKFHKILKHLQDYNDHIIKLFLLLIFISKKTVFSLCKVKNPTLPQLHQEKGQRPPPRNNIPII